MMAHWVRPASLNLALRLHGGMVSRMQASDTGNDRGMQSMTTPG